MNLREFYACVLPPTGRYVLFQNYQHTFHETLDDLTAATETRINTQGLYFATASFAPAKLDHQGKDINARRTQANVRLLSAHRIDIDAGPAKFAKDPEGTYPDQAAAKQALLAFVKASGIMPTLIVSSGEGLHVYYALSAPVTQDVWRPTALALNACGKHFGLKIDAKCTADSARVLRPIGTLHKNGKRVELLKNTGHVHDHAALAATLEPYKPEDSIANLPARAPGARSINDEVLAGAEGPPSRLDLIANHCSAVALMRDSRGNVPEPHWYGVIGLAKYCDEGDTTVHEWSSGYAGYSARETQSKLDHWETPPPTCNYFAPMHKGCAECPHRGKITTPKQLGYVTTTEKPAPAPMAPPPDPDAGFAMDADVEGATPALPVPSRPDLFDESADFFYKVVSGRWVLHRRASKLRAGTKNEYYEILLPIAYRLVWVDVTSLPGASEHDGVMALLGVVRRPGSTAQVRLRMPAGILADPGAMEKFLLDQGINTDPGKEARGYLKEFLYREAIRAQDDVQFVTRDRFGYHFHDGEFLCTLGQYAIYPDGRITRAMFNSRLGEVGRDLTIACMPDKPDGKWGPDVWRTIAPHTVKYINFLREHYSYPGYENARLALALSLASPMLIFAGDSPFFDQADLPPMGFVVSLYSRESGLGKSSVQDVIAAAYGKPTLRRAGKKSAITDIAAATLAKSMAIYPFLLDEVTQNDSKQAAQLIDTFANGAGRIRANNTGAVAKSAETWALISCISTNVPQRELIALSQKQSDALQMRLLELNFDGIKPVGDKDAFRAGLQSLSKSAGAFGAFLVLRAVSVGPQGMADLARKCLNRAYVALDASQQYRFFARGLAAMLMMNELLGKYAPFSEAELIATFVANVKETNTFVENTKRGADADLEQMISDMSANIIVTKTWTRGGTDIILNPHVRLPIVGREVQDSNVIMIESPALHKWCALNELSSRHFLEELQRMDLLVLRKGKPKSNLQIDTGLPMLPTLRGWYYTFKTQRPMVPVTAPAPAETATQS